jgi:hypothetical protein
VPEDVLDVAHVLGHWHFHEGPTKIMLNEIYGRLCTPGSGGCHDAPLQCHVHRCVWDHLGKPEAKLHSHMQDFVA